MGESTGHTEIKDKLDPPRASSLRTFIPAYAASVAFDARRTLTFGWLRFLYLLVAISFPWGMFDPSALALTGWPASALLVSIALMTPALVTLLANRLLPSHLAGPECAGRPGLIGPTRIAVVYATGLSLFWYGGMSAYYSSTAVLGDLPRAIAGVTGLIAGLIIGGAVFRFPSRYKNAGLSDTYSGVGYALCVAFAVLAAACLWMMLQMNY